MTTKEKREQRAKLVHDAGELLTAAKDEKRSLSDEEQAQFNAMHDDADRLKGEIDDEERAAAAAARQAEAERDTARRIDTRGAGREDTGVEARPGNANGADREAENRAFTAWLRFGIGGLTPEQRQIVAPYRADLTGEQRALLAALPDEQRALSVGTDSAGGYTVPEDFMARLEEAMLAFGGMRETAEVFTTATGADMPWPSDNDTATEGEIIAENTQHNEGDITFGSVTFNAYLYSSKIVRVSMQLLQDSAFNVDALIASRLGTRLARITNRHFTIGTGTGQPKGIVVASTAGKTFASASAVTHTELVDLQHSVDPAYRVNGRWMFHDTTLRDLKKLVDDQNRPLWLPGVATREPDLLLGDPYTVNQHMPQIADGAAKSILYGDLSSYKIRDVRDVTLLRLVERYADYLQVGFLAFLRSDGDQVDAGTNPVKHGVHPSA